MPGLLRGVARTAVIAGTASAVSGRVQRHQAEKYAERDAGIAAQRTQAYDDQMQAAAPAPAPAALAAPAPAPVAAEAAPAPLSTDDLVTQLKALAELRDQGILTDDEFAEQKARLLG